MPLRPTGTPVIATGGWRSTAGRQQEPIHLRLSLKAPSPAALPSSARASPPPGPARPDPHSPPPGVRTAGEGPQGSPGEGVEAAAEAGWPQPPQSSAQHRAHPAENPPSAGMESDGFAPLPTASRLSRWRPLPPLPPPPGPALGQEGAGPPLG